MKRTKSILEWCARESDPGGSRNAHRGPGGCITLTKVLEDPEKIKL
jgi:hypothetical protein